MKFKDALLDSLNNEREDKCLISADALNDNHIALPCGHKFNYIPLYNEIIYQKRKPSCLESTQLMINQFKCPYCRTISNQLIPYQELSGVYKLYGINSPEKYVFTTYKCEWKYKNGPKKNTQCNNTAGLYNYGCYCSKHIEYIKKETLQCKHILQSGRQCKNKCKTGDLCYIHK